jgi:hypothetical protein
MNELNLGKDKSDLDSLDLDEQEVMFVEETRDESDEARERDSEQADSEDQDEPEQAEVEVLENAEVDDIPEEDIKEDVDKKTDNEIIEEYLRPNTRCILCTTPIWSLKLNKAFLDGRSYNEMIDEFSTKFEERSGRSLNKSLLHRHFKSHFDARAAAIAEYNKRRKNACDSPIPTTTAQRDIFKLATSKYLDELEMFDATAKEMIQKYQELETIIVEKKAAGKSFGIDELIVKQASLLNALNKQAISKFKALSKVDLENKQGQFLTQLSFIGNKAVSGLAQFGKQQMLVTPLEAEKIYINVVIRQILARLEDPLKCTFGTVTKDTKTLFFRELRKSMEGIEDAISIDFDHRMKTETQRLIENKNTKTNENIDIN